MKLLHVFPSFAPAPMALRLAEVAKAGRKVSHHVVSLDGDLSALDAMPETTTSEAFLARRRGPDQLGLRQRIGAIRADILCTYGFGALDAATANAAGPKLAHIHHEEASGAEADGKGARLRTIAAAGGLIVVSWPQAAETARKRWRIPARSLRLIEAGVDTRRFRPPERRAGEGELVTIGYVGALDNERKASLLFKAFAGARARLASRLVIYGEGLARPSSENLARTLGVRRRIFFRETPKDLDAAYDEFDALVFLGDGASEQLLAAMASGLAVAAENVGDVKATLARENRSLIVSEDDAVGLAAVLARLVNDAGARELVGSANVARVKQDFTLAKMSKAYLDLYRTFAA
ncbi:MAG: glycosyltransferase family 4 protein [Parvularculaceae bacterium]